MQKTVVEKPTQNPKAPSETISEEEQEDSKNQEDQENHNDHEDEKEQRSMVLFTPKQLLKMNRLDFTKLVGALKGGSSKGVGFKLVEPGNFNGI
jgi:hypothetical protein